MNIIFAGTATFALPSLQALIASTHHVTTVLTQPDRPAGRGQQLKASVIKECAIENNIPVQQPERLNDESITALLKKADVMVVVAYGLLIPKRLLALPTHGCINVHPSLLPRWRGAAPIQHTLLNGDTETGVSIIQMNERMDAGDILKQNHYNIRPTQTSAELHDILAQSGAELLLQTLTDIDNEQAAPQPQSESQVTLAGKFSKADAHIDWQQDATQINNQIRAYNSWPVAFTNYQDKPLRIWTAEPIMNNVSEKPGTLVQASKQGLDIACGDGMLRVLSVQQAGGKRITAQDFINAQGDALMPGQTKFGG